MTVVKYDETLSRIDEKIQALRELRREVETEKQTACEHDWTADILHYGGLYCTRCQAVDYSDACSRIDWHLDLDKWPFEVAPRDFCWNHKRAASECVR